MTPDWRDLVMPDADRAYDDWRDAYPEEWEALMCALMPERKQREDACPKSCNKA